MASFAKSLLKVIIPKKGLKLFFVGSFSEVNSAKIFKVRLHILHESAEPISVLVESEEEVDASVS